MCWWWAVIEFGPSRMTDLAGISFLFIRQVAVATYHP